MKHPCFDKGNRACDLNEVKRDGNKLPIRMFHHTLKINFIMMKKELLTFVLSISFALAITIAQVPTSFTYQAVARNNQGAPVSGKNISVKLSILQGSASGSTVFEEEHSVTTNSVGLFSLEIGSKNTTELASINWGVSIYFIKVEVDVNAGTHYTLLGTSQLLSVPYALYAKTAGNTFSGNYSDLSNKPIIPSKVSDLTNDAGFIISPNDADSDAANELQVISISNDTIYLTNGGFAKLPAGFSGSYNDLTDKPVIPGNLSELTNDKGFITNPDDNDADSTNELQAISISNDTIYLTNGGFVKLPESSGPGFSGNYNHLTNKPFIPANVSDLANDAGYVTSADDADADPSNELQTLSISNDTIYLTNGSFVKLPASVGFSGSYNDLSDKPAIPAKVSDLTNDAGYVTSANDADADATNEIQSLKVSAEGDTLYLSKSNWVIIPGISNASSNNTWEVGDDWRDSRDGQVYATVEIDTMIWMAQNLAYKTDSSWYYNNDSINNAGYGRVYEWADALNACPSGWHLPTETEWQALELALGMPVDSVGVTGYRGVDVGTALKTGGSSGFDATMGGYRDNNGFYDQSVFEVGYWTGTESNTNNAYRRKLYYLDSRVERDVNNKFYGYYVRCVKDN